MSSRTRNISTAGVTACAVIAATVAFAPTPAMAFSMGGFGHMGGMSQVSHVGGMGQIGHVGGMGQVSHFGGFGQMGQARSLGGVSSLGHTSGFTHAGGLGNATHGNASHGMQTERSIESHPREASSAKTDSTRTDSAKTETAKTETAKTETAKTDSAKTDSAKTDSAKTETAKTETGSKPDRTSDVGRHDKGHDRPAYADSDDGTFVPDDGAFIPDDSGVIAVYNDVPVADTPIAANGGARVADPREARLRPGDVVIRNDDGSFIDYVRRGHDVVLGGTGNTSVHVWCGDGGELYIVCRDYNNGTAIALAIDPTKIPPVRVIPPVTPPKKDSWISLYNPDTNTTTTRFWPGNGGPTVTTVEAGNTLANH